MNQNMEFGKYMNSLMFVLKRITTFLFFAFLFFSCSNKIIEDKNELEELSNSSENFGIVEIRNLSESWNISEFYYSSYPYDEWSHNIIDSESNNTGSVITYTIPVNTYSIRLKDDWNYEFLIENISVYKNCHLIFCYDGFKFIELVSE